MTLRLGVKTDDFFKECRSEGVTLRLGVQTDAFFKKLKEVIGSYRFAEKLEDVCLTRKCLLTPSNSF